MKNVWEFLEKRAGEWTRSRKMTGQKSKRTKGRRRIEIGKRNQMADPRFQAGASSDIQSGWETGSTAYFDRDGRIGMGAVGRGERGITHPWPPFTRERGWGMTQTCNSFPCRTSCKGDTTVNPCLEVLTTTHSDKSLSHILHSSHSKTNPPQKFHVPWTPVGQTAFPKARQGCCTHVQTFGTCCTR